MGKKLSWSLVNETLEHHKVPSQKLLRPNPRFGRSWLDLVGFVWIWLDLVGFGRVSFREGNFYTVDLHCLAMLLVPV